MRYYFGAEAWILVNVHRLTNGGFLILELIGSFFHTFVEGVLPERRVKPVEAMAYFVQRYSRMHLQFSIVFQGVRLEEQAHIIGAVQEVLIFALLLIHGAEYLSFALGRQVFREVLPAKFHLLDFLRVKEVLHDEVAIFLKLRPDVGHPITSVTAGFGLVS